MMGDDTLAHPGFKSSCASDDRVVVAVDVGTTSLRCHIYNKQANVLGKASCEIVLIREQLGWVEIDPDKLWTDFVTVVKGAISDSGIELSRIACLGISTQRGTILTWDKKTGKPLHNFVTWMDLRADNLVKDWNNCLRLELLRAGATFMHAITHQKRYLSASVIQLHNRQVNMRLKWLLENIPSLRERAEKGEVLFGMIESWLLWKMTGGREHSTDFSCASSTALFDPFTMEWSAWFTRMLNIPIHMLPQVKDTSGFFGNSLEELFGVAIPITALVGDQQSAMFGQCCFEVGSVKCTMGTGAFIDINTGSKPHSSVSGVYPLVAWKIGGDTTYTAESAIHDTGTILSWAKTIGIVDNVSHSSSIATSVEHSGGTYFVPAFHGLQAPINDNTACAGFLGLQNNTSKPQLVRSLLESVAFRIVQLYSVMQKELGFKLSPNVKVDGGVANNDFVLQTVSDLTRTRLERSDDRTEMSCLGAAFLSGLAVGIWKNKAELVTLKHSMTIFEPNPIEQMDRLYQDYKDWQRAVCRCQGWYKNGFAW